MSCRTRRAACARECRATASVDRAAPTTRSWTSRVVLGNSLFATQPEQLTQVVGAHLGDPGFAGAHDGLGQRHFALDQVVERLFESPGTDVFVYLDVAR